MSDAHLLEEAGCFALVLEKIPASLAERVARELTIPVIGIGAGGAVDGQVLVVSDMLGMTNGFSPRFLRRYADLHTVMTGAIQQYVDDVKKGDNKNIFPVNSFAFSYGKKKSSYISAKTFNIVRLR